VIGERLIEDERPHEECGVFGLYAPGMPVAEMTYAGLLALQHRGQEGAGIFVTDGSSITGVKDVGLVTEALRHGESLKGLPNSDLATGQVRYGTHHSNLNGNGSSSSQEFKAVQPMLGNSKVSETAFTVSHNGHIINSHEISEQLELAESGYASDSDLIVKLIVSELDGLGEDAELREGVAAAANRLNGAYSLVIMGTDKLIGLRDPKGIRPLWLGEIGDQGGMVLASELSALYIIKATPVREIEAGELVEIGPEGITSYKPFSEAEVQQRLCALEFDYFSRPDNELEGENVELVRFRKGKLLAERFPLQADIVVGSPNSGMAAARGYANASGLPMEQGLVKNDYVGRTFIANSQLSREQKVRTKFNANRGIVGGKRVVLVDDTIVRGTTTKWLVDMLREAGAEEVHLRISAPPIKWSCYYGMDTPARDELIAAGMSNDEVCQTIGADSLEYLSLEDLQASVGKAAGKLCMACMDGQYPTPVNGHR